MRKYFIVSIFTLFFTLFILPSNNVRAVYKELNSASQCNGTRYESDCSVCMDQGEDYNSDPFFRFNDAGTDLADKPDGLKWQCGHGAPFNAAGTPLPLSGPDVYGDGIYTYEDTNFESGAFQNLAGDQGKPASGSEVLRYKEGAVPTNLQDPTPGGADNIEECILQGIFPSVCLDRFGVPPIISNATMCTLVYPEGPDRSACREDCLLSSTKPGAIFTTGDKQCPPPGTSSYCQVRYPGNAKCIECAGLSQPYNPSSNSCTNPDVVPSDPSDPSDPSSPSLGETFVFNPDDPFANPPFPMMGVSCGVPITAGSTVQSQNKCCVRDDVVDEEDLPALEAIITKFDAGEALSVEEVGMLKGLVEASGYSDEETEAVLSAISTYQTDPLAANLSLKEYLNQEGFGADISDMFRDGVDEIDGGEIGPARAQIRKLIPAHKDKCLVNIIGKRGLCLRGILEFGAQYFVDATPLRSLFDTDKSITAPQCTRGEASDDGAGGCFCQDLDSVEILCEKITSPGERSQCQACLATTGTETNGVWTGIGCIWTGSRSVFEQTLLGIGVGVGGGASFLCILYAAYIMQASRGNPERLKKAREYLNSCLIGLLMVIFSILILQFIGFNVLRLPEFGS